MADLDVSASVLAPTGWIELEDAANGYELHKDSFARRATSHRKTEVANEWVPGTYVTRSVRESVSEDVVVYVRGASPFELSERVSALTDAYDQLAYSFKLRIGDLEQTWSCASPADYTVETQQEFWIATLAVVRATVPRLPAMTIAQVA